MILVLPRTLPLAAEDLQLLSQIDEFKGHWKAMESLVPERLTGLRRVATIESIGSSTRIEGSRLTDREVENLLGRLETKSFATRDEQEVAGYAFVMEQVFAHAREIPLTINMVQQLHRDLLQFSEKDERHRGQWKSLPNHVSAFDENGKELGIVFATSSPFDTPFHMEALLQWHREAESDTGLHPLVSVAVAVVIFLAIHPFQDGNGRLSRILTTLLLLRAGYSYAPYSSLESVIEANKEAYYMALRRTQISWQEGRPDWEAWLRFFLRSLMRQIRRLQERIDARPMELTPGARRILELLNTEQTLTLGQVVRLTGLPESTAKVRIKELLGVGRLLRHGQGKGTYYTRG
jgi:Fic family protein